MGHEQTFIQSKIRVPALAEGTVDRPRVRRELQAAAEGRAILLVVASAGAGKTTAVAQFVASRPGPHAWLTLGEADDRPGRFVTYLAAALDVIDVGTARRVQEVLGDGLSPEDCAALLGESCPAGATLVIDDLHHAEAHAAVLRTLRAFLDSLGSGVLVVLVSRRLIHLDFSRDALSGRVGAISDRELAFEVSEIAELLTARDLRADPAEVETTTGGWAAGVVFDALRGSRTETVLSPTEDPFFAYLGSEVLDALPTELREVVLQTGLLDVLTPERLGSLLGVEAPDAVFAEICRQHLPGTLGPDGLRYHPRFREFLLARLARERPEELRELTARYARILLDDGHVEDAADYLLAAGQRTEAEPVVENAAPILMHRGDWDKVLSWCAVLGGDVLARRPHLRGAQIRALLMSRRQDDVAALVPEMQASGEFARLTDRAPDVAAWAVWALHGSGEWRRLLELVPERSRSRRAEVIRYIFTVGSGEEPPPQWATRELDLVQPLHVALQSAFYYQGRFAEVERLAWAAAGRGPVTAVLAEIYRIAVLRVRGELAAARTALEATAPRVRASRFIEFWQQVEAELLFGEGEREHGLSLIREARRTSREHGYRVADRAVFAGIEGKMLMRMGALPEAVELLTATRQWCAERGLSGFREWADTWLAGALLALGRDPAEPLRLLREAVAGMQRAGRRLELPAACVFLAEAEWRMGDEAAHDAAADAGYDAACACGTLSPLLAALEDMPDVLARRLDAAPAADETWRTLIRGVRVSPARTSADGALLRVRTFGAPALESGEKPVPVSPAKAVELAAALASAGARGVSRSTLIAELFEGSLDGANYLRQLVHRLRRVLPAGLALLSSEGRLAWLPAEAVVADDQLLESLLTRARREVGDARADTLARALALAERGPYLAGVDDEATLRRRDELAQLVSQGRREYARCLLAVGRPLEATVAARDAVRDEPFHEEGWQLLMRAQTAADGPAAALPVYLECQRTLQQLGLAPSEGTRELLGRLRR